MKRYISKSIARKTKVRAKLKRFSIRPRLSVFRSNKYIYAQIIDDNIGKTIVAASEKDIKKSDKAANGESDKGNRSANITIAYLVGQYLAKKALKKKVKQVYFDRGQNKYHGRIKSLAKGAREGGLEF